MAFSRIGARRIQFTSDEAFIGAAPEPLPAVQATPDWYRSARPTVGGGQPWGVDLDEHGNIVGSSPRSTFKNCVPFLDAMSIGYVIPLWNDLVYEYKNGRTYFSWPGGVRLVDTHPPHQVKGIPRAEDALDQAAYKFESPWTIRTPPGYSCLFTMPFNHFEDRYQIVAGVVDTDEYHMRVSFPFFWLADGISGTIPVGHPLVQVVPFKRDSFRSTVRSKDESEEKEERRIQRILGSVSQYGYRLRFHRKKSYR